MIRTINPSTGENLADYEETSPLELSRALEHLKSGFRSGFELGSRVAALKRLGELLRERKGELAKLCALEMGKPLAQGEAEAEKCAGICDYFAGQAGAMLEPQKTEAGLVRFDPLGLILGIMPWNYPVLQVIRFAVPALLAGNSVALKHALGVTATALKIEGLFHEAGFGGERFKLFLLSDARTEALIRDPRIAAVSLTGSPRAGRAVAAMAGAALKKCVLELGGSDAYVVLEDADIEFAAETCVSARLINSGQSCIAAKRFIVAKQVGPAFFDAVLEKMRSKRLGDPFAPGIDLGPLARKDLRELLQRQVSGSLAKGASRLLGGEPQPGLGFFYPPTILAGIRPGMPAFDEETFGPVAALITAENEEEALRLANLSVYGLGAAIFTRDPERARRLIPRLEAGQVFINQAVHSDARLPFGGVKQSGFGRELSAWGLREFVNVKTVAGAS